MPHLPGPDDVVQRLECFLNRSAGIKAMDLIEIDVVRSETFQRRINRIEEMLP